MGGEDLIKTSYDLYEKYGSKLQTDTFPVVW